MDKNSETVAVEIAGEIKPPLSVGTTLREARISQGLTVADVASSIKFAPRQVEALEADDFSHLPELAFVRGFVRSYARLLQIDEVPLLNELPLAHQKLISVREDLADVPFSASQSNRRVNVTWLAAALGLAAVLGLGVWLSQDKSVPKAPSPTVATPIEPAPVLAASEVAQALPMAPTVPVTVTSTKPPSTVLPKPAPQPAPTVPLAANKLTQGPIHLVFDDESWVDIKDKFGKTLLKQVNPAKSEQWVTGRPPFALVIGNASNVHLYFEGEEIDLDEFTDVEVARLILE